MKTVKMKSGEVRRVTEQEAAAIVAKGNGHYASKMEWKATREQKSE